MATVGTTIIRGVRPLRSEDSHQRWDIDIAHNGQSLPSRVLKDTLAAAQYITHIKYVVFEQYRNKASEQTCRNSAPFSPESRSHAPTSLRDITDTILACGRDILLALDIDRQEHRHVRREVLITEALADTTADSIHNHPWELQEISKHWKHSKPGHVAVTRVFTDLGVLEDHRPVAVLTRGQPLNILLIIGRKLQHGSSGFYDDEEISPGIVQNAILQARDHMRALGQQEDQIRLEVLMPVSYIEIEDYLKDKPQYDLIHLDMHGRMVEDVFEKTKVPRLILTQVPNAASPEVSPEAMAILLGRHTKLLVTNACNGSNLQGGLGIPMIKSLLKGHGIECVAATTYPLIEQAAEIFYPVFYMSLVLKRSFNQAAADARRALWTQTVFDAKGTSFDALGHWNWSNTMRLHLCDTPRAPSRSPAWLLLHWAVHVLVSALHYLITLLCWPWFRDLRRSFWRCQSLIGTTAYALHRHFQDVHVHVSHSRPNPVSKMSLYGMEMEHLLQRTNPYHAIYMHSWNPDSSQERECIEGIVEAMIPVWLETDMFQQICKLDVLRATLRSRPDQLMAEPGLYIRGARSIWARRSAAKCWRSCRRCQGACICKKLLIITGVERFQWEGAETTKHILRWIVDIATCMDNTGNSGDLFVITIGSLTSQAWGELLEDCPVALRVMEQKWGPVKSMRVPYVDSDNIV